MKRVALFLISGLAALALWAQQATIVPRWQVGDSLVYHKTMSTVITRDGDSTRIEAQADEAVTVLQRTATGYVVAVNTLASSSRVTEGHNAVADTLLALMSGNAALLNLRVLYATDSSGKPVDVLNWQQLQEASRRMCDSLYNWIAAYAKSQSFDLEMVMPKQAFDSTLQARVSKERLLQLTATSPLYLYGKNIAGGEYTVYKPATQLEGAHVERALTAVQSADDLLAEAMQTPMLKQLLASMPASMLPMIKEQLKSQLGQGLKKTDATVYDCYVNGWIRKIADSITIAETKSTTQAITTSECVYHSWK